MSRPAVVYGRFGDNTSSPPGEDRPDVFERLPKIRGRVDHVGRNHDVERASRIPLRDRVLFDVQDSMLTKGRP